MCRRARSAVAVLRPRSKSRDVALYALQMWAFISSTRCPTTIPSGCGAGCGPATRSSSTARSAPAAAQRPAAASLARLPRVGVVDRVLTWAHWLWFFEPYLALAYILLRHPERFPRAARQLAAVFDLGCVGYFAVPTAPPWWASEQGLTGEEVRRIMVEVGEETWGSAWPAMYGALGGNPWAAMPSLHFATSADGGDLAGRGGPGRGRGRMGLRADARLRPRLPGRALRHRPVAGRALVAAVRRGEPLAEPLVAGRSIAACGAWSASASG